MFTTASVACLMRGRNAMNTVGSGVGRPSLGSRACRCRIAAAALAASIDWGAIWSGVIGSASDIVVGWIEPVMAQVMTTLLASWGIDVSLFKPFYCAGELLRRRRGATICEDDAPFKGEKLKAEALHGESPEPFGRLQHDHNRHQPQHDEVNGTQVGQELTQQEEHERADDRPLDAPDAANHGDENHEGGPVVDAEGGVGRDPQLLQEDERANHRGPERGDDVD